MNLEGFIYFSMLLENPKYPHSPALVQISRCHLPCKSLVACLKNNAQLGSQNAEISPSLEHGSPASTDFLLSLCFSNTSKYLNVCSK